MRPIPSEWQLSRERGRKLFRHGDYVGALLAFQKQVESGRWSRSSSLLIRMSFHDEQLALSNIVACRLKIGGLKHARAAVKVAKTCINLNPRWSKAHVRLASAYLCLDANNEERSDTLYRNKCNNAARKALRMALHFDPDNSTAQQMLQVENGRREKEWKLFCEQANTFAQQRDFVRALDAYQKHLESGRELRSKPLHYCGKPISPSRMCYASTKSEQIALHNIALCRLCIGGLNHAKAAVDDALACVAVDSTWSKAHDILASAYVLLGMCERTKVDRLHRSLYSDAVCNALELALHHDPANGLARRMLQWELRLRKRDAPLNELGRYKRFFCAFLL
jgi:tetratricopeptide (TPR) repeat protein